MILQVVLNGEPHPVQVPNEMVQTASAFFAKMDADMDSGWQMSRTWVDCPDQAQRCQIAADRMLTAMENHNQEMATMMAAYILARMPQVQSVDVDTSGDMTQTRFDCGDA